jgi:hypothetical protein
LVLESIWESPQQATSIAPMSPEPRRIFSREMKLSLLKLFGEW